MDIVGKELATLLAQCEKARASDMNRWQVDRLVLIDTFERWFKDLLSDDNTVHPDTPVILMQLRSEAYRYFKRIFMTHMSAVDMIVTMTFHATPPDITHLEGGEPQKRNLAWKHHAIQRAWTEKIMTIAVRVRSRIELDEVVKRISCAGIERRHRRAIVIQQSVNEEYTDDVIAALNDPLLTSAQVFLVPRT